MILCGDFQDLPQNYSSWDGARLQFVEPPPVCMDSCAWGSSSNYCEGIYRRLLSVDSPWARRTAECRPGSHPVVGIKQLLPQLTPAKSFEVLGATIRAAKVKLSAWQDDKTRKICREVDLTSCLPCSKGVKEHLISASKSFFRRSI